LPKSTIVWAPGPAGNSYYITHNVYTSVGNKVDLLENFL
jgi:hypothetical protein